MGANSRSARSGQKSGIGKGPARSSNSGSDPLVPHSSSVLLSPASTSSSRTTSAPKRKNLTPGSSSRRSSTNSRASRKSSRPSAPRPQPEEEPDEFIADIIVVNTDSPDHSIDMDDEVSETMISGDIIMYVPCSSRPSRDLVSVCSNTCRTSRSYLFLPLTKFSSGRILTTLMLIKSLRLTLPSLLRRRRSRLKRVQNWQTHVLQARMYLSRQRLRKSLSIRYL